MDLDQVEFGLRKNQVISGLGHFGLDQFEFGSIQFWIRSIQVHINVDQINSG